MKLINTDDIKYQMLYKENFLSGTGVEAPAVWKSDIDAMPAVDAVPVVRCKDCAHWCICHHGDNWFCADGTPINTASDYYDDKGHLRHNPPTCKSIYPHNPPTCKSIYGERRDE